MKKILLVLLASLAILDASAQGIPINYIPGRKAANQNMLSFHKNQLTRQSVDTIYIDYDLDDFNLNYGADTSLYSGFIWPINSHVTLADTFFNGQEFSYYTIAYDSIFDPGTGDAFLNSAIDSIYIDSVIEVMGWTHNSLNNDTVVISILKLNASGYPTDLVLATDSFITCCSPDINNEANVLYPIGFSVNQTFAVQSFGVRVQFFGAMIDTAYFDAGFPYGNVCNETGGAEFREAGPSVFYPNTYLYWEKYGLLPQNSTNTPNKNGDIYYPCNHTTQTFDPSTDGYNFVQNANSEVKIAVHYSFGEGINKTNPDISSANVYPNPVGDNLKLYYTTANATTNSTLNIYDITGNLINSVYLGNLGSGSHEQDINTSNFASGIYLYSIYTQNGNAFGKFVKQ